MDLIRIATEFNTEEKCLAYLEAARWPEGVRCIHVVNEETGEICDSSEITKFSTKEGKRKPKPGEKEGRTIPARHLYQCKKCGYQFTAKTETLFNDSHLPLIKWFLAVALITNAKKGLSAKQLERDLKVSYQTAWYVSHRVREAMSDPQGIFDGVVELDETFHGGKYSPRGNRGKYEKQAIMGVLQRGTSTKVSQVKAFPIADRKGPTLTAVVKDHVSDFATIYTDEFASYRPLNSTHYHEIVIHSRGEYVRGNVHTNTIEGFWSLFERQVIGQHHFVSVKHLQRYLNERTWAYNNRGEEDLFWLVLVRLAIKAAMPYAKLTEGPSASPRSIRRDGGQA